MNKQSNTRKKNILFLEQYGDRIGGGQVILLDIVKYLRSTKQWNVFINLPDQGTFSKILTRQGFSFWNEPIGVHSSLRHPVVDIFSYVWTSMIGALHLRKKVKANQIELIYCNGGKTFLLGFLLSLFSSVKVVWHLHLVLEGRQKQLVTMLGKAKKISRIIAVSNMVKEEYQQHQVYKKIEVIYNWVSPRFLQDLPEQKEKTGSCPFELVIIGQISQEKGQLSFLQHLEKLDEALPLNLKLVGEPLNKQEENWQRILEIIQRLRKKGWQIEVLGYQEDIPSLLDSTDLLIIPSLIPESFGLTAIEAMARGTLVMANAVGALPEVITDKKNGFLFDIEDDEQCINILNEIIKEKAPLQAIREASFNLVTSSFYPDKQLDKIDSLLHRLLRIPILEINGRSDFGGGPKNMYRLLNGIDKKKFEFIVACPNEAPFFQKLEGIGSLTVYPLNLRKLTFRNFWKLLRIVRTHQVKIVHSQGKAAGIWSRMLKLFFPSITVVHHFRGIHYKQYPKVIQFAYFGVERLLSTLTKKVVHVSHSELEEALKLRLVASRIQTVLANGVETYKGPPLTREQAQKKFCIDPGLPVCIVIARYSYQKNLEDSFRVIRSLLDQGTPARFVVIGGADDISLKIVQGQIEAYGLQGYVTLAGEQSQVIEWLCIADIYLSTARWEGLPTAILEAMSIGLPVVGSNVVGNISVLTEKNGFLIEEGDIAGYTHAIQTLLQDRDLYRQKAQAASQLVNQNFSVGAMIEHHEQLYLSLMEKGVSPK
ncbi:MAG: hypothetical protein COB67_09265 [SAR324 cluster bacterium]|uniref:Glycosyltransferase n=1 Tax=SAR324 cluster bacterium TaxID=2024889 RepID=A0A2A4T0I1_9DELT|nr:MAG: hypothetical protein COB67_09265 [SAR324 cluster bacterium]